MSNDRHVLDLLLVFLPMPPGMIKLPHAMLSIADWLDKQGLRVLVWDTRLYSDNINASFLSQVIPQARYVGVSVQTAQIPFFLRFVQVYGDALQLNEPSCSSHIPKLIVGGIHPFLFPGQFDAITPHVCREAGEDWAAHLLLGDRKPAFDITTVGPRNWRLVHGLRHYWEAGFTIHGSISGVGHMSVESSRGCNAACSFCINQILPWGRPWRPRPEAHVLADVAELKRLSGGQIDRWTWEDEYVFANRDRISAIAIGLKGDLWGAAARVRDVSHNPEWFSWLYDHGLRSLNIGVESGNPETLKRLRKPHTPDDARECARILQGIGIRAIYSYIVRLPGETQAQINDTLRLMAEIQELHPLSRTSPPGGRAQIYRKLPGTPLAEEDPRPLPESLQAWAWHLMNEDNREDY